MMFISTLLIETGQNPDRPRPGRVWLRNLYHVHQRLCMAFPAAQRKTEDPLFIKPFDPKDFGEHVHVRRQNGKGFLFRIDPVPGGRAAIIVQSAIEPDWDYAFHNVEFLVAAQTKPYSPAFEKGETLRFRLLANPVKKLRENSVHPDGKPVDPKWKGKRVPVPVAEFPAWLDKRAERAGFEVDESELQAVPGYVYAKEGREREDRAGRRYRSVRYDGLLKVADPPLFAESLAAGLGPAKAFGFGLLSVARPGP